MICWVIANNQSDSRLQHLCSAVLAHFDFDPQCRVLCFLDYTDPKELRDLIGVQTRGAFYPLTLGRLTQDLLAAHVARECKGSSGLFICESVIYLFASTCKTDIGLVLTLAHELQHCHQHQHQYSYWFMERRVRVVSSQNGIPKIGSYLDLPSERDAIRKSKEIAQAMFGSEAVAAFIHSQIQSESSSENQAVWNFLLSSCEFGVEVFEEDVRKLVKENLNTLREDLANKYPNAPIDLNLEEWPSQIEKHLSPPTEVFRRNY